MFQALTLASVVGLLPGVLPATNARPIAASLATVTPDGSTKAEAVQLESRDKVNLAASYFAPKKRGKNPAVVLVHDAGSDRSKLEGLAEYLQRKGIAVLTVDVRGHGESATDKLEWAKLDDERAQSSMWSFAAGDVRLAVDWLRERDEVHSARVAVAGVGAGASLAVSEALDDRDTSAVALIAPGNENHGFNLSRNLSDLGGLPALILSPKESRSDAQRLQSAAHSANGGEEYVELAVLKSSRADVMGDKRLGSELAKWLKDTLDPK